MDSVATIGNKAFLNCSELTSVFIGSGVASIGGDAFDWCGRLETIEVASENTVYHSSNNCLIETATETLILGCKNSVIPNNGSVTAIGGSAFSGCDGLTSITIPESVTAIGDYAFYNCSELTSIIIPDSVATIGNKAFLYCSELTSVFVGSGVTYIGDQAFNYCNDLKNITYNGTILQWRAISKGNKWLYIAPVDCVVHCTDGDINL